MAQNTIQIQVLANVQGINQGIQNVNGQLNNMGNTVNRVGGLVKNLVTGFLAFTAVRAVGTFLQDSITAASDLNETVNKSNTIFGAAAASVNTWAQTAATSVGLSRAAALDAASGFGNMFTQLGFTSDAAAQMSTSTVQMAADLGSFNNLPTADVIDKISGAMRGEYDSLQALIPNINAARVEQEAMAATGKTNASELTAQEKAAATLAIVQRDGAAAMGDFAATSDGLANQQKILAAKFEDVKSVVGQALLPIMSGLASIILDKVVPAAQQAAAWFGDNVVPKLRELWSMIQTNVLPILQQLGSYFTGTIIPALQQVIQFVQENGTAFATAAVFLGTLYAAYTIYNTAMSVWAALTRGYAAVQLAFNAVMAINPFVLIIIGLTALVAALIYAWNNSETFRNVVTSVWEAIKTAVSAVLNWFTGTLWPGIQAVWNGITTGLGNLASFFTTAWNNMTSFVSSIPGRITGFFSAIPGFFSNLWGNIVSGATSGFNNLISYVSGIPGRILSAVGDLGSLLLSAGRNVVEGLWRGIQNAGAWLRDRISGFIDGMVDGVLGLLGINSPSRVFAEIGQFVTRGLGVGINDRSAVASVDRAVGNLAQATIDGFGSPKLEVGAGGSAGGRGGDIHIHLDGTLIGDTDESMRQLAEQIKRYMGSNGLVQFV